MEAVGLAMPQMWWIMGVSTSLKWSDGETNVVYRGETFRFRSGDDKTYPDVSVLAERDAQAASLTKISRLLSAIAWIEGWPIREASVIGSGAPGTRVGRTPGEGPSAVIIPVKMETLLEMTPAPTTSEGLLALALDREGLGINSDAFAFLSFFKILNIRLSNRTQHVAWINANIADAVAASRDPSASTWLAELQKSTSDIGAYLYESGRCAVAHSNAQPLVDPDESTDIARLAADLPLAKSLAERFIEHELGIKSRATIYREHEYMVAGLQRLLGRQIVASIVHLKDGRVPSLALPAINVRLRGYDALPSLQGMIVQDHVVKDGVVCFQLRSKDPAQTIRLLFSVDFNKRILDFDPYTDIKAKPATDTTTASASIDMLTLQDRMTANAIFEIRDASNGDLLGRMNPFLPMNIDGSKTHEMIRARIAELKELLDRG